MIEKALYGLVALLVLFLVVSIPFGVYSTVTENNGIRENCAPTEYVVIGNKGRAERVYDCSGADIGRVR